MTVHEYDSFQTDLRHRHSLVDSTPTTKEETFEMPPWSSSAGSSVACLSCGGVLPPPGGTWVCTLVLGWCHGFRSTIVLRFGSWSESGVFSACSVVGQFAVLRHAVVLSLHLWMCEPSWCMCLTESSNRNKTRRLYNLGAKSASFYRYHSVLHHFYKAATPSEQLCSAAIIRKPWHVLHCDSVIDLLVVLLCSYRHCSLHRSVLSCIMFAHKSKCCQHKFDIKVGFFFQNT